MVLVLTLQLLALSWPLCHTGVISDGTQEAQGPPDANAHASFPRHRSHVNVWNITKFLELFPTAPPPAGPPSHPIVRRPRPFNPHFPFPYPKPKQSVPPTSAPKPPPAGPPSHPTVRKPRSFNPHFPFPNPKPKQSVPPTSAPKPPKPSLAAQPTAVVTPGVNVTLTCRAPQPALRFVLKLGEGLPVQYQYPQYQGGPQAMAQFLLEAVTAAQGGSYRCEYFSQYFSWSQPSDALELMVTELLPRPSLEALPGAPLRLRCTGHAANMSFALYRAGEAPPLQVRQSALPWADFPLPRARAPGTYTCYYHTPAAPYVLSPRSEPLVIGPEGSGPVDYTQGNAVRLALAGLVLLALALLLGWEWRDGRRAAAAGRGPGGLELGPAA